ncbi:hypothetical protein F4809DRAFT_597006 [Biscogniauxia mediterranea]|nr:hypothetical protein F4809DRAFT_597006 [Biscogniauxia mediterranea]
MLLIFDFVKLCVLFLTQTARNGAFPLSTSPLGRTCQLIFYPHCFSRVLRTTSLVFLQPSRPQKNSSNAVSAAYVARMQSTSI